MRSCLSSIFLSVPYKTEILPSSETLLVCGTQSEWNGTRLEQSVFLNLFFNE